MFRVTRYPMISKTESGRIGYRKKYRVAGRVRVPAGHWSNVGTFRQVSTSFGLSKRLISAVFSCFGQILILPVRPYKEARLYYILLTYYYRLLSYLINYELTSYCFHLPTTTGDCHFRHLVAWLVPVRTQSQSQVSRFNVSSPITGGGHITLQTPPYPKEMCFHWDKRPIQSTGSLQS